ncbi:MAG: hypothetical protein Q8N83_06505 [Ignavibacteria bacterium]|nr:hypothetical protein [Ignavibacteria bacterium]
MFLLIECKYKDKARGIKYRSVAGGGKSAVGNRQSAVGSQQWAIRSRQVVRLFRVIF